MGSLGGYRVMTCALIECGKREAVVRGLFLSLLDDCNSERGLKPSSPQSPWMSTGEDEHLEEGQWRTSSRNNRL